MSGKEKSGKDNKAIKQQKPAPAVKGLEPLSAQAEAMGAYQKAMASPRPPFNPEDILALQQTAGNQAVQRMLAGDSSLHQTGLLLTPILSSAIAQRTNGEGLAAALARGGTVPVNLDNDIPFGNYVAHLELHGQVRLNPFSISLTGQPNGITIMEGNTQCAELLFDDQGGFHSFGIDLMGQSASLDADGNVTTENELGPVTLGWEEESRELSASLDVLGIVWPADLRASVENVGEVTSDFNLALTIPEEGDITLSSIGMDLGIAFGPEQVRAVAEFSVSTTYGEEVEYTEASGSVEVQINVFGIEETIPLYEDEARAADLGLRHEQQLVQTALRYAFAETYRDIRAEEENPRRADIAIRDLHEGFNVWYRMGYVRARQSVIDRYAEHDIENVRMHDGTSRRPLTTIGQNRVTMDGYCRRTINDVILPHPDPPGARAVRDIWDNLLQPHFSGGS